MKLLSVRAGESTGVEIELSPSKIIGIGVNYRAHAVEMGKPLPAEPLMFLKPPSAMIGDGDPIHRPGGFPRVDHEAELGVVIASRAHRVPKERALDFVLGLVCINDVSVRELQARDGQWARAKGFDSFCPIGPRLVSGLDPADLRIQTRINGEIRQDSRTSDLIFDVPTLIAFVSEYMTLEPGDVISTGTPAGVGNMSVGDVCEVEIEGIGVLRNPVVERA